MTREEQEILNRVKLLMKYDLKNTLSENESRVKSLLIEKEIYGYNYDSSTATYENAVFLDTTFSSNLPDLKNMIIDFSCKIPKTDYIKLIGIMIDLADKKNVYPISDSFYAAERGTKRSISQWLIETYLQVDIQSRIDSKTLSNSEKSHYYGYFIRVPIGWEKKKIYRQVDNNTMYTVPGSGSYQPKTIEVPYEVNVIKRQSFGNFNDKRYQDYIKKLESRQEKIVSTDISAIPSDWKEKVKKIFGKDVNLDCYSICNEKSSSESKKEEEKRQNIKCPFKSDYEEQKFRKWVNENYPEIAKELDLDVTVPPQGRCNDFVMKAVNYVVKNSRIPKTTLEKYDSNKRETTIDTKTGLYK
jgi:hypothetical protein